MGRNKTDGGSFATGMTDDINDAEWVEEAVIPEGTRRLRVYDNKGDFVIDIPEDARATFGYFNPASAGMSSTDPYGRHGGAQEDMRRTALRIYGKGGDKNQLAVFCGVKGFRDEGAIKLVRLREEIKLTSEFVDDGKGNIEHSGQERRQLIAVKESEIPF